MDLMFDLIAGAVCAVRAYWVPILFVIAFAAGAVMLLSSIISFAAGIYAV